MKVRLTSPSSYVKWAILCVIIVPFWLNSQESGRKGEMVFSEYELKTWHEIDGVLMETIFDIEQDSTGYIWLATNHGLLRYNGALISAFDFKNVPNLETETIRFVEVSNGDSVYFSTRAGLYRIDGGGIYEIMTNSGEAIRFVNSMVLDAMGTLWFTNFSGELYTIQDRIVERYPLMKDQVLKAYKGKDGTLILVGEKNGITSIFELDTDGLKLDLRHKGEFGDRIYSLAEDRNKNLIVGTVKGKVARVEDNELKNLQTVSDESPNHGNLVRSIALDGQGSIWHGGTGLKRTHEGFSEAITTNDGLTNGGIQRIFVDRDDNIWVGTVGGLNLFSRSPFRLIQQNSKNKNLPVKVLCVAELGDGTVLTGSESQGLMHVQDNTLVPVRGLDSIGNTVFSLYPTGRKGGFLVGSEKGVFEVAYEQGKFKLIDVYSERPAARVFERSNGEIWFSTIGRLQDALPWQSYADDLYFDHMATFVRKDEVNHVVEPVDTLITNHFFEDSSGRIWVSTSQGVFSGTNWDLMKRDDSKELSVKWIQYVDEWPDSRMWVGTWGRGLIRKDQEKNIRYDTRNGMSVNQTYMSVKTGQQGFWFYKPDFKFGELQHIAPYKKNGSEIMRRGHSYALMNELSLDGKIGFPTAIRSKNGSYLLAGVDGLVVFDPTSIKYSKPSLFLEKIRIDGQEVTLEEENVIDAEDSNFEFHYASVDFKKGERQSYEYRLKGYDDSWRTAGNQNVAYYSSLPAGKFRFEVRTKDDDDNYILLQNPLSFEKKQFWYKTSLAYMTYLLGVVALVVSVFQFRLRTIKRQRRKLQLTVEERTRELEELNENLELKVAERTKEISKMNDDLVESEERYKYALDASNDGIWDWDVDRDHILFSPSIFTMLGYEPFEFEQSRRAIYDRMVSKEDRENLRQRHDELAKTAGDEQILDEYKMYKKNGDVIWILLKAKIVERNQDGTAKRIVGTHTDITVEKRKNKEILEAVLKTENVERTRISREIHDGLQQTLTVSSMNFRQVKKELSKLSDKAMEKFNAGWKNLEESIAESRAVAHSLMPKAILDFGIIPAFESLIDKMNESSEGTKYQFYHNFKNDKLENQQVEITLYRILQEAINNIVKYSKATEVTIQLKDYDEIYMLTVEDNGVGFDQSQIEKSSSGLGFQSMRNRLEAVNGFLEIDSRINGGTTLLIEINKMR